MAIKKGGDMRKIVVMGSVERHWNIVGIMAMVLVVAIVTGCGKGPKLASVSGKVTIQGTPITRGTVTFMPVQSKGTKGKAAIGNIDSDGNYVLGTFSETDGAIVGHHRVTISGRGLDDADDVRPDKRIHPRYCNRMQSGLTAEVESGSNTIDFTLHP